MKEYAAVLAALLLLAAAGGTVAADEGPLAEAGLDQTVDRNTTVQLDGTGSSDPNGTIEGYEWSIETPDGREITPSCHDCARTDFRPQEPGRYDVTLTVTDEDGRTDSDTLYVFVEEAGPTVELTGDTEPPVGEPTTYNATAETTKAELDTLTWKLGNQTVARDGLSRPQDTAQRDFGFTESETYRLIIIVRDSSNRTARDSLTIEPQGPPDGSDRESGGDSPDINDFSSPDEGGTRSDCQQAAVVGNPTGSGTAAAVTCADGDPDTVEQFADETCSATIEDCELADPRGQDTNQNAAKDIGDASTVGGDAWWSRGGSESDKFSSTRDVASRDADGEVV